MTPRRLTIACLGLSMTSSWGNGHATTFRSLLGALAARGHEIAFLERDVPWYADNRDLPSASYARIELYYGLEDLRARFSAVVRDADVVLVGSYVPDGTQVIDWVFHTARGVRAFYDIDTPVTLEQLAAGAADYIAARQLPGFDVYFSFTGGGVLRLLEERYGARRARALYCCAEPVPDARPVAPRWDLGYLGTYSADRQPALHRLLVEPAGRWPAGRFVVAGPQFPEALAWPANVERFVHLPPADHAGFYRAQRFTLNVTRAAMVRHGYSPSVRLFEAAATGTAVITDWWEGLDGFFAPDREILVARSPEQVLRWLRELPDEVRLEIGSRARARFLGAHTAAHRAESFEAAIDEAVATARFGNAARAGPPVRHQSC
jgi:spore maturation protein CgeB